MLFDKAKIRGEVSEGMLCSAKELRLGSDHAGILEIHGDFQPGEPLVRALGLDDVTLDIIRQVEPALAVLLSGDDVDGDVARRRGPPTPRRDLRRPRRGPRQRVARERAGGACRLGAS